jgi:hypothetical protein
MDPFAHLPWPLPLAIMKELPDFQTLQMLLQASPDAEGQFNLYGLEIIEAIATSTLDLHLPCLLTGVIDMRAGRAIPHENESTWAYFVYQYMSKKGPSPIKWIYALDPPPARTLHGIVAIDATIERLTLAVLVELQDNMTKAVNAANILKLRDDPNPVYVPVQP